MLAVSKGIGYFDVEYVPRERNQEADSLARQAFGYEVRQGEFDVRWEPLVHDILDVHGGRDELD
jgi:hypothetical protein